MNVSVTLPVYLDERKTSNGSASITVFSGHCTFGIAWHQQHYLSLAARVFRQFVMEYSTKLEQDNLGLP
jgi:hypothetical protein